MQRQQITKILAMGGLRLDFDFWERRLRMVIGLRVWSGRLGCMGRLMGSSGSWMGASRGEGLGFDGGIGSRGKLGDSGVSSSAVS